MYIHIYIYIYIYTYIPQPGPLDAALSRFPASVDESSYIDWII